MSGRAKLLALAERHERRMLVAAACADSTEPWYQDRMRDMAYAANCATVAAALRALAARSTDQ